MEKALKEKPEETRRGRPKLGHNTYVDTRQKKIDEMEAQLKDGNNDLSPDA